MYRKLLHKFADGGHTALAFLAALPDRNYDNKTCGFPELNYESILGRIARL